jgi:uncharacterized integral membrane protein
MRVLFWIAGLLLTAAVVSFALSNRQTVAIALWPLTDWNVGLTLPVYLAVLAPFVLGLALGWLVAGWRGWRRRRRADKKVPSS